MGEDIVVYLGHGSECDSHIAVSAAVVKGDTSRSCVRQGSAWEAYIWHEAPLLILRFGSEEIVLTAVKHP